MYKDTFNLNGLLFCCRYLDSYATDHIEPEGKEFSDLDIATLRLKRKRTNQRKDTYSPRPDTSQRKLGQCLVINPTKASSPTSSTQEENIKFKHYTTFMPQISKKEKKMIQNGLYASAPTRSSTSETNLSTASGHTYKFNSINSYLKFNDYTRQEKMSVRVPIPMDINASVIGQGSASSSNQRPEKRVRSKQHREIASRLTSARDSDIAALGDLEEFFVVTTPHIDQKSTKSLKSGKSTKSRVSDVVSDRSKEKHSSEDILKSDQHSQH